MARYTGMFRLFPVAGASEDGFIDTDKDIIKKSVLNIINTHKGSRVYDADYGTNLHRLLFEPNIQRTRNIAKAEITEVIKKYEPRAKILNVNAFADGELSQQIVVIVSIYYVEFNEQEDLEIRMSTDQQWISKEGAHYDPLQEFFNS